jgi:hypothetical protein
MTNAQSTGCSIDTLIHVEEYLNGRKFSNRITDLDEPACKASNDEAACIPTSRLSNE